VGNVTGGLTPSQQQALTRFTAMWSEIVKCDPSMEHYSEPRDLTLGAKHRAKQFPGNQSQGILPTTFFVVVSFDARIGGTTEMEKTQIVNGEALETASVHVSTTDIGPMEHSPPYFQLLGNLQGSERETRRMTHQLLHELVHARILMELFPVWPVQERTLNIQRAFDVLLSDDLETSREALKSLLYGLYARKQRVIDFKHELLYYYTEKFTAQYSFAKFNILVTNQDLARLWAKKLSDVTRGDELAKLEAAIVRVYDLVDERRTRDDARTTSIKPNSPTILPRLESKFTTGTPGWRDRPGIGGIRQNPPWSPRPTWIGPLRPPPSILSPTPQLFRLPSPGLIHTPDLVPPNKPPAPAPHTYIAPSIQPISETRSFPPAGSFSNPPASASAVGPFPSTNAPPAFRDRPMAPGPGSGWDPERFGFAEGGPGPGQMAMNPPHDVFFPDGRFAITDQGLGDI
jgi:hypothetical protein